MAVHTGRWGTSVPQRQESPTTITHLALMLLRGWGSSDSGAALERAARALNLVCSCQWANGAEVIFQVLKFTSFQSSPWKQHAFSSLISADFACPSLNPAGVLYLEGLVSWGSQGRYSLAAFCVLPFWAVCWRPSAIPLHRATTSTQLPWARTPSPPLSPPQQ